MNRLGSGGGGCRPAWEPDDSHGAEHGGGRAGLRSPRPGQEFGGRDSQSMVAGAEGAVAHRPVEGEGGGRGEPGRGIARAGPVKLVGKALLEAMGDDRRVQGRLGVLGGPQQGAAFGREQPFMSIAGHPVGPQGRQVEIHHAGSVGGIDEHPGTGMIMALAELTRSKIANLVRSVSAAATAATMPSGLSAGNGSLASITRAPDRSQTKRTALRTAG